MVYNDKTKLGRNIELESAFRKFMDMLQNDVQTYLGKDIPFMVKIDVKIGVEPKNENKMKIYEPRLTAILNTLPTLIKPIETVKNEDRDTAK